MSNVIIDTSAWIQFFRYGSEEASARPGSQRVGQAPSSRQGACGRAGETTGQTTAHRCGEEGGRALSDQRSRGRCARRREAADRDQSLDQTRDPESRRDPDGGADQRHFVAGEEFLEGLEKAVEEEAAGSV